VLTEGETQFYVKNNIAGKKNIMRPHWTIWLAIVLISVCAGIGGYAFVYAKGYSYLTDDPQACLNCHAMTDHFNGWVRSSHHIGAVCNNCHAPHSFIGKYYTKGLNGFWHSFYFTSGNFPDVIQATPRNKGIAEAACRNCHSDMVDAVEMLSDESDPLECNRCHDTVGHPNGF